jgi:hypothetical protein
MKMILRILSMSMWAILLGFWSTSASAQAVGACASLANGIAPNFSKGVTANAPSTTLQQVLKSHLYVKCLQSGGESTISGAPDKGEDKSENYTSFDPPGSTDTEPTAINPAGAIVGSFFDTGGLSHSFVRTHKGAVHAFDPPGAPCPLPGTNFCSRAVGITPDGAIAGEASVGGFLLSPDGAFTTINVPSSNLTSISAVSTNGAIIGLFFVTGSFGAHGFVRTPGGAFTTFDPPGSTYTAPTAINPDGAIVGFYLEAGGQHGFVRTPGGALTTFDPPGSTGTQPTAISPAGVSTGNFLDASGIYHGFVRAPNGVITVFDAPGINIQTLPVGITPEALIVGWNLLADFSAAHGFLRAPDGSFTEFDEPNSIMFTMPSAINPAGAITGNYLDANFVLHGFLRSE